MISDRDVARAQAFDVCILSDALDSLGLPGAVAGIRPVWLCERVAARVVTMRVVPADEERSPRHLGVAAIEASQPGDVVVIEQRSEYVAATWGGLLSRAARVRGIAGVVIDGACRDVDEIRELGLPLFARTVVPFTARRRVREDVVMESIVVDRVAVSPGDLVVADGTGVVFVAADAVGDVLDTADRLTAREAQMAAAIDAGVMPSEVMGAAYEEMLDERR